MGTIIISGREITSRANAYAHLAERLLFPNYYGRNLDALHDCLTEVNEPTHIIFEYCNEALLSLGSYGAALLKVLNVSAEENSLLSISFNFDSETYLHN